MCLARHRVRIIDALLDIGRCEGKRVRVENVLVLTIDARIAITIGLASWISRIGVDFCIQPECADHCVMRTPLARKRHAPVWILAFQYLLVAANDIKTLAHKRPESICGSVA